MHVRTMKLWICAAIACSCLIPVIDQRIAAAAGFQITEVMTGLVNPRGLSWGPDGSLYVAEAGRGGDGPSVVLGNGATANFGLTSGLTRLRNGIQERVLDSLPSVATSAGADAGGLQEVQFDANGRAVGLFSFGADAAQRDSKLSGAGLRLGTVTYLPLGPGETWQAIADIAAYENVNNPAGGSRDSNPFGMAILADGRLLVADSGANDVLSTSPAGSLSTLVVLPNRANPLPIGPPFYQSVPTTVSAGPDGAFYIGQLTGFPFPAGAADVYRLDPASGTLTVAHAGFTNIVDMSFDASGNLYVLQISSNGLGSPLGPGTGLLYRIDAITGNREQIAADGLLFPTSVLAGPAGEVYVTNRGTSTTAGQVLRLAQVPEPSSCLISILGALLIGGFTSRRRKSATRNSPAISVR